MDRSSQFTTKSISVQPHCQSGIGLAIASGFSLLFYSSASLLEAANRAKGLPWHRSFTVRELMESLQTTTIMDVVNLGLNPSGSVAVAGMILFLLYSITMRRRVPTVAIWFNLLLLPLLPYGWAGPLLMLFFPAIILLGGMDGEFLSDGFARVSACGFWTIVLILTLLIRWFHGRSTDLTPTDI